LVVDADDLDWKVNRIDKIFHELSTREFHSLIVKFLLAPHNVHLNVELLLQVIGNSVVKVEIVQREFLRVGQK
jgi:hypothetical protein